VDERQLGNGRTSTRSTDLRSFILLDSQHVANRKLVALREHQQRLFQRKLAIRGGGAVKLLAVV
jgi:hypothetical protein